MYNRYHIEQIISKLDSQKILILYGPRQVGKTTISKVILSKFPNSFYYNCDLEEVRNALSHESLFELSKLVEKYQLIVLDEAQRIENIGLKLKILIDNFPEKNIIVTGSSSFDLSSSIKESLAGRYIEFLVYPISEKELVETTNFTTLKESLGDRLIYGSYPEVLKSKNDIDKIEYLKNIKESYLFKDILGYMGYKDSTFLLDLLKLISFQVGNEVSLSEIGVKLGVDKVTVSKYLDLLEDSFILFSLSPYSFNNLRKSVTSYKKYYFVDLGIRNLIIENFNNLSNRDDEGKLFENYLIIERIKKNQSIREFYSNYFFRDYEQNEIDYIESHNNNMSFFEFKYNMSELSQKTLNYFKQNYGVSEISVINNSNYQNFIL